MMFTEFQKGHEVRKWVGLVLQATKFWAWACGRNENILFHVP
jgi:hypothetical protein